MATRTPTHPGQHYVEGHWRNDPAAGSLDGGGTGRGTTTIKLEPPEIVSKVASGGKILGMMAIVGVLGVVGAEIRNNKAKGQTTNDKIGVALASPFIVFAGVTVATVILVSLAQFGGEPGETLAEGLAGVALVGTLLVQGAPIFDALGGLFKVTPKKSTAPQVKGTVLA